MADGDGSFGKRLAQLARLDLLILGDFGIAPIAVHERNDLLELLDAKVASRSTHITLQLPVTAWYARLDEHTLAVPSWTVSCAGPTRWPSRASRCASCPRSPHHLAHPPFHADGGHLGYDLAVTQDAWVACPPSLERAVIVGLDEA